VKAQTKRLNETPTVGQDRSVTIGGHVLASQWNVSRSRRTGTVSYQAQHQGYRLTAQAEPVKSALHAAHLVIEGPNCSAQRCFHALDYFYDPAQALQYAIRWGRIWVDHRLANIAAQRLATASLASSAELLLKERRTDRADDHE
jgi:hypothetical protein